MFLIYGTRSARIKKYTDNHSRCESCKNFDLDVEVYRSYYHVYYIPFVPIGEKTAFIRCNHCGEPGQSGSLLQHYEKSARTPFYLFTIPILILMFIATMVYANFNQQKEKVLLVANPLVGDVYGMRKEDNNNVSYFFLRVSGINGDTVIFQHSNLEYGQFVSGFNEEDFFVKDDEFYFLKPALKQMLEKDNINSVYRNYDGYQGFNRIK